MKLFVFQFYPVPADIFARSKDFLPMQDENNHDESSKRSEVYQGKIYIEAMLTADKTTCDFYGNGTRDYLLNSANLVRWWQTPSVHLLLQLP